MKSQPFGHQPTETEDGKSLPRMAGRVLLCDEPTHFEDNDISTALPEHIASDGPMRQAVERAIDIMWNNYGKPLSLSELADAAILSRFYFSRVFRSITGTSPGRFLTAIRLYEAKRHLLESGSSVISISYRVGYNSPGTFTSRFTSSVGMSPTRYRLLSQAGIPPLPHPVAAGGGQGLGAIRGLIHIPDGDVPTRVYIGAFDSPIAQGQPSSLDIVESSGSYRLDAVPDGLWFVRAAAVAVRDLDPRPWLRRPLFTGSCAPVLVRSGQVLDLNIDLHPTCALDLPVLLALPELDSRRVMDHEPQLLPVAC
jgi:AraC family transcriptional regulator